MCVVKIFSVTRIPFFRFFFMMKTLMVFLMTSKSGLSEFFSELANRTGIPAFYVSFVLAPLASNSSELLASYNYALKKTTKTIKISLSTLQVRRVYIYIYIFLSFLSFPARNFIKIDDSYYSIHILFLFLRMDERW